jgi:hypothetical protein
MISVRYWHGLSPWLMISGRLAVLAAGEYKDFTNIFVPFGLASKSRQLPSSGLASSDIPGDLVKALLSAWVRGVRKGLLTAVGIT